MNGERTIRNVILCCARSVEDTVQDVAELLAIEEGFDTDVLTGLDGRDALEQRGQAPEKPTIFVVCIVGETSGILNPLRQALADQGGPNEYLFAALLDPDLPSALVTQIRRYAEALEDRLTETPVFTASTSGRYQLQLDDSQEELAKTKRFRASRRTNRAAATTSSITPPKGKRAPGPIHIRSTAKYRAVSLPADGPFVTTTEDPVEPPRRGKTLAPTHPSAKKATTLGPPPSAATLTNRRESTEPTGPRASTSGQDDDLAMDIDSGARPLPEDDSGPSSRTRWMPWLIGIGVLSAIASFAWASRSRPDTEDRSTVANSTVHAEQSTNDGPPVERHASTPRSDQPPSPDEDEVTIEDASTSDHVPSPAATNDNVDDISTDEPVIEEPIEPTTDTETMTIEETPPADSPDDTAVVPSSDHDPASMAMTTEQQPASDAGTKTSNSPPSSEDESTSLSSETPSPDVAADPHVEPSSETANTSSEADPTVEPVAAADEPAEKTPSALDQGVAKRDLIRLGHLYIAYPLTKEMSWNQARSVCNRYTYAGVKGWRLPSSSELRRMASSAALRSGTYWSKSTDSTTPDRAYVLIRSTRTSTTFSKEHERARPVCIRRSR